MSCTSCNSTVLNPITGCGVDPCSTTKLSTDSIFYTGPTLSCSGIDTCTTVTEALQNLDYKICNPPAFTFTANNGLTKTVNNVQLGGPLIQQTVIGTTAGNSLVITGLVSDPTPDFLVSQDSSGLLTKTAFSAVLGAITASNGLTKVSNDIRLGGALTGATTITTTGTNTLTVAGLVTDASPAFIVTQSTGGQLVKTLASSIIPTPTPTVTADNGLTKTLNNIQLGGALIQNTSVSLGTYGLTLRSGVSGQTGIQIIPGAIQDCIAPGNTYDWNTDVFNVWGKIQQDGKSWFKDNVGIGVQPDSNNSSCGNRVRLTVDQSSSSFNTTFSGVRSSTYSNFYLQGTLGNDTSNAELTSSVIGSLYFSSTGNVTLKNPVDAAYSGVNGRITFTGSNGGIKTSGAVGQDGVLAAVASRSLFTDAGGVIAPGNNGPSLSKYVGFQALAPQPYLGNTYTGTIDDVVGVQIEDQRGSGIGSNNTDRLAGKGLVTNSWGVRQLGALDRNVFFGNTGIGATPYPAVDVLGDGNNSKLFVARSSGFRNSSLTTASDNLLEFTFSGAESPNIIAGITGRLNAAPTFNISVPSGGSRIAAVYGYMQYTGTFDITNGLRNGLTGVFGQCGFSSGGTASPTGGDIGHAIALRAGRPLYVNSSYYGGTIANAYGLYIEDQRDDIDNTTNAGYITNSYGVYQEGASDVNYFKGAFQLPSSNLSIGTATLVAGTVTVATTAVKTGAKIFLSVNTPGGTQGFLSAPAASITNGVSFVINSTSATDTSTVNWWIINS